MRGKPPPERSEGGVEVGRLSPPWVAGTGRGRSWSPAPRPAGRRCGSAFAAGPASCGATGWSTTFSLADYDRFRFGWKIEGEEDGWSNSLIFRVDNSPTDFHVLLRPLAAEIASARADARGGDQYGEFRADGWFTADTRLWRRLVLLAEGTLVVCDRLEPGRRGRRLAGRPAVAPARRPPGRARRVRRPGAGEFTGLVCPLAGPPLRRAEQVALVRREAVYRVMPRRR